PERAAEQKKALETSGDPVLRDRLMQKSAMVARRCTALAILEETEWPDRAVPWIPVVGDELEIDGERDYRGVIRDSKDAARAYNVQVSALIEAVGQGLQSTVVGWRGQ